MAGPKNNPKKRKIGSDAFFRKLALIVAVMIPIPFLLLDVAPGEVYSVRAVYLSPEDYENQTVAVRGTVENWTGSTSFSLADEMDTSFSITVVYEGSFPDGFRNNATVVARGSMEMSNSSGSGRSGEWLFLAYKLEIACPSKY